MATEKYIVFPPGVDFSKLLGERGVGIRGVELYDEEEEKEGESGSEDENAMEVDNVQSNQEDSILDDDHDDLDILSMPDPDDLREFSVPPPRVEQDGELKTPSRKSPTKLSSHAKLTSSSPSKRVISDSVSPTKRLPMKQAVDAVITPARKRDIMKITPMKSSSPTKRRKISDLGKKGKVRDKDAASEFDGDDGVFRSRVLASEDAPMDVDEKDIALLTPLKHNPTSKAKSRPSVSIGSKKAKEVIELEPDLALSDNSNSTLDRTPEMLRLLTKRTAIELEDQIHDDLPKKSSPQKRVKVDDESYRQDTEITTGSPSTEPTTETTSTTSSAVSQPPPKKRLTRRLTNEPSLELEREKEKEKEKTKNRSTTKLIRRAMNGRVSSEDATDHESAHKQTDSGDEKGEEKENIDETQVKSSRKSKSGAPPPPKRSLLKLTRGDARTRVKAKSARAKARELYSDSEDEVMNIVEDAPAPLVAPVPTKDNKGKIKAKGTNLKRKESRSEAVSEDEESRCVESESEEDADQSDHMTKKAAPTSIRKRSSKQNLVEVVINAPMMPTTKTQAKSPAKTYSLKPKAKKPVIQDEDKSSSETEQDAEPDEQRKPKSKRSSLRQLRESASVLVGVEEKATNRATKTSASRGKLISKRVSTSASKPKSKSGPSRRASPSPDTTETHTPVTDTPEPLPAKRGAAARAEERLKVMMPDAIKFEAELRKARKSGGGMRGIRIDSWEQDEDDAGAVKPKKRESDQMDVDERMEDGGKKSRKSGGNLRKREEGEDEAVEISSAKKGKAKARPSGGSDQIVVYVFLGGLCSTSTANAHCRSEKIYLMTTQVALPDSICKARSSPLHSR
jgi:hypothetical protein